MEIFWYYNEQDAELLRRMIQAESSAQTNVNKPVATDPGPLIKSARTVDLRDQTLADRR